MGPVAKKWIGIAALAAILAGAAVIRFIGMADRPVGHVEIYTPNIPFPQDLSDPPPRLSLVKSITGSFWEPHPPLWYALMYPWTRLFGSGPVAMRFPSLATGVLAVLLIYLLGRRLRSPVVGLVAAALLAGHGLHIQWSQMARPVILVSTFGLLSSWTLFEWLRRTKSRVWLAAYAVVSLAAMATDYYFWILFAGQMVWVALRSARWRQLVSVLLWQCVILLLASPLIVLVAFQKKESYLGADLLRSAGYYVGFGNLFTNEPTTTPIGPAAVWVATAIGAVALLLALFHVQRSAKREDVAFADAAPSNGLIWLAFAAGVVMCAGTAFAFIRVKPEVQTRILVASLMPFVVLAAVAFICRFMPRLIPAGLHAPDLVTTLALFPPLLVGVLSLAIPFIDPKYILVFTPYLLILVAEGLVRIVRSTPRWPIPVVTSIVLLGVLSWTYSQAYTQQLGNEDTPDHWKSLGRRMTPELRETDLVLSFKHWAMTPIYYYLPRDTHFVGIAGAVKARETGSPRIWMLSLRDTGVKDSPRLLQAVEGCHLVEALVEKRIRAELYDNCPHIAGGVDNR